MDNSRLIKAASLVRRKAFAPYSKFAVGAALQAGSGKIYTGCNVENLSFGLTLCAERSAVSAAVSDGSQDFVAIAIVTDSKEPAVPCGACRQVLSEFNRNLRVICATVDGDTQEFDLANLLPLSDQGILGGRENV